MTPDVCARLRALHGDVVEPAPIAEAGAGGAAVSVRPGALADVMGSLREDPQLRFEMLLDAAAIDHAPRTPRFELAYQLRSVEHEARLTVRVTLADDDPRVGTLTGLWPSADWLEREIWDLHGLRFIGHPKLERLFLGERFQGHPLRKDFPGAAGSSTPRQEGAP